MEDVIEELVSVPKSPSFHTSERYSAFGRAMMSPCSSRIDCVEI